MRTLLPGALLVLALAGCGTEGVEDRATTTTSPSAAASTSRPACPGSADPAAPTVRADLDGDGTRETVRFRKASGGCPTALVADVAGQGSVAPAAIELPVAPRGLSAVTLPSRSGDLVMVRASHPRGGFQVHLFGYSEGVFEELTVEEEPIFDFIATDVMTDPTAVTCAADGFEVLAARAHEPVGAMAAWDVFRTVHTVEGNTVTRGPTTEVADNVDDRTFERKYARLVSYDFFTDCRAG